MVTKIRQFQFNILHQTGKHTDFVQNYTTLSLLFRPVYLLCVMWLLLYRNWNEKRYKYLSSLHCQFQFRIKITFKLVTLKGTKSYIILFLQTRWYWIQLRSSHDTRLIIVQEKNLTKYDSRLATKDVISTLNSNSNEPNKYHTINRAQCDKNMKIRHILNPFWQCKPWWLKNSHLLLTFGRLADRMTRVTEVYWSFQTSDRTSRPVWQWPLKFLIIY
jgi:hypothetical protein